MNTSSKFYQASIFTRLRTSKFELIGFIFTQSNPDEFDPGWYIVLFMMFTCRSSTRPF